MRKIVFVFIVGLLLTSTQNLLAQKKIVTKKNITIPEWKIDFKAFIKTIKDNSEELIKSEFETNSDFGKRVKDKEITKEYQSLLRDTFSFFLNPSFISNYNAENETLTLTLEKNPIKHEYFSNGYSTGCKPYVGEGITPIYVLSEKVYTKKYKASNALGNEIDITQNYFDFYYLYSNDDFINFGIPYTFHCKVDIAKNKVNFKYKFYFTLNKMYFGDCDACTEEPTFNNPIKDCIHRENIYVNIHKIEIMYNKSVIYTIKSLSLLKDTDIDLYKEVTSKIKQYDISVILAKANDYLNVNDLNGYTKELGVVLAKEPNNIKLLEDRASAYAKLNNWQGYIEDYSKLISLDANNADYYNNRAYANYIVGTLESYKAAIVDYNKVIELGKGDVTVYTALTALNSALKDYNAEVAAWDKLVQLQYDNFDNIYRRGAAKYNAADYKGAIADFDKVIGKDPKHINALKRRAIAKIKLGDKAGAKDDEKLIKQIEKI